MSSANEDGRIWYLRSSRSINLIKIVLRVASLAISPDAMAPDRLAAAIGYSRGWFEKALFEGRTPPRAVCISLDSVHTLDYYIRVAAMSAPVDA